MAKMPRPVTIDFETFGIEGRPHYPPLPVGVAIKYFGKPAKYYGWGHPTNNNCGYNEAQEALRKAWDTGCVLFQNGKFDVDVAEVHMGMPRLPWDAIHDTLFLIFLDDPNQKELGLKPSAERLLNLPPEERDKLVEWLVANQPVPGVRITPKRAGAYIAFAPGDLVGRYCIGDVDRTEALFKLLWPSVNERGMVGAYDRERKLMPVLLDMERHGVPVDLPRLEADVQLYQAAHAQCTEWLVKKLKQPDVNIDSGSQLMQALINAKLVDEAEVPLTEKGAYKADKAALAAVVNDAPVLGILKYRTQLGTSLNTFMIPWLEVARKSGGMIYTSWNQVKSAYGSDSMGTRTGRLSSTPNFQNIPNEFSPIFKHDTDDAALAKKLPKCPFKDLLPPLPVVRSYITARTGMVLLDRDYSSQEPRILGHYDGNELMERYNQDPWTDFHGFARDEIERIYHKKYDRKPVKNINLGLIYGQGVGSLAEKNGMSLEETKELKDAILSLYPGLKSMYSEMRRKATANEPIYTWGGREYYCEPPKIVKGRVCTFDYKMINTLIQGSAADCTKEALVRYYYDYCGPGARIILQVHDELVIEAPEDTWPEEMERLKSAMESVEFDVPMLSEGKMSYSSFAQLVEYDKHGVITYKVGQGSCAYGT